MKILAWIGLLALTTLSNSKSSYGDIIFWSADRRLAWSDFQGKPDYDYEDISALTSSGIIQLKGCENGLIIYKIKSYFEKKESWVKPEALTEHHLQHEQIHFDITELFARKLRKALTERQFFCGDEAIFEQFVNNFLENWKATELEYDLQTHFSMRKDEQNLWKDYIQKELALYEDYRE